MQIESRFNPVLIYLWSLFNPEEEEGARVNVWSLEMLLVLKLQVLH